MIASAALLIGIAFTIYSPVRTVKALLVDTGLPVGNLNISLDANRVAWINSSSTFGNSVFIYDIASGSTTNFPGPNTANRADAMGPAIYGDKVVAVGNITALLFPFTATIGYCVLPHTSLLQSCGPWHLLATGMPQLSTFFGYGTPVIHGDLVAWWTINGFAYHLFSTNTTETHSFASPAQPVGLSTNGEIIAFTLATNPGNGKYGYCGPLEYFDVTNEAQGVVNTGLTNCVLQAGSTPTSISQYTIVFNDNSTGPNRIRYYDYLHNQASPAGTGPLGNFTSLDNSAIWGDRILFSASEKSLNFDCDGDGLIQSNQACLDIWNIRAPSYVATNLAAKAAPSITGHFAIYNGLIVFRGSNGDLQYVTVPMQGDVDQDGVVDVTDKNLLLNCMGQVLKGNVC
jgi:hypothetical protein